MKWNESCSVASDSLRPHGLYCLPVFPGVSAGKKSACNVEDLGSIPGLGRFPWRRERLPTPLFWPGVCSNSCPLSTWHYLTISSSATPCSFCLQSFPASESFPMSRLFVSGGKSISASASASVLPVNIQCWFPLGLTGLISLLSKGLSRVFSSITVLKHQL